MKESQAKKGIHINENKSMVGLSLIDLAWFICTLLR